MKQYIYLINQQDAWCAENNNGQYIIAAFTNEEKAKKYAEKMHKKDSYYNFYVWPLEISGIKKDKNV